MTLISLATFFFCTFFLCALSWPFARSTRASGAVAIMAAVSFAAFLACVWCAAPGAMDTL